MTDWSDDDIDALVRAASEPIDEGRFEELVERAALPLASRRAARSSRRPAAQRWLVGLSAAAAVTLVVVVVTQGGGDRRPGDVAGRPATTAADGTVAAPSATVRLGGAPGSPAPTDAELSAMVSVLDARIAALGIEAEIAVSGGGITITLADPRDRSAVVSLATFRGDLQFRPVLGGPIPSNGPGAPDTAIAADAAGTFPSQGEPTVVYDLGPSRLGSSAVETATRSEMNGSPAVRLTLRTGADGIDAFNRVAAECFDPSPDCPTGALAVVLDGVVLSAPRINAESFERDQIMISGSFTARQADDLIVALRSGALPLRLVVR